MSEPQPASGEPRRPPSRFDAIVIDLRRLRIDAGEVSFAEIAARIATQREADGHSPGAARVARSTVYDAFQTGRRRLSPELVREIVRALGGDEAEADAWRQRCLDVRRTGPRAHARPGEEHPVPRPSAPPRTPTRTTGPTPVPWVGPAEYVASADHAHALRAALVLVLLVACVGVNLFGGAVIIRQQIPLYLDMIGTAAAAFVLGPWHGAVVGLSTNVLAALLETPGSMLLALVTVAGARLWGYGIRRFASTIPRFLLLNVVVSLVCAIVAVPINVLLADGVADAGRAAFTGLVPNTGDVWTTLFSLLTPISLVDKLLSGAIGLLLARLVAPLLLRGGDPVPRLLERRGATTVRQQGAGDGRS